MISVLTLNPSVDRLVEVDGFKYGGTNCVLGEVIRGAGKGVNAAVALKRFGAEVEAIGFCGARPGPIEERLQRYMVPYRLIPAFEYIRTNIKVHNRADAEITEINETGRITKPSAIKEIFNLSLECARASSYFIISGSVPEGCPDDIYGDIISAIKELNCGCKCVVDTSRSALSKAIEAAPFIVKPNLEELEQYAGRALGSMDAIEKAAVSIKSMGVDTVLVTMGRGGALLFSQGQILFSPCMECEQNCTVGAGDSMMAAMVASLDSGDGMVRAFEKSVAAAAAYIGSKNSDAPDMELYREYLDRVQVVNRGRI